MATMTPFHVFPRARTLSTAVPGALLACLVAGGCSRQSTDIELSGPTMGTTYTVKVAPPLAEVDSHRARVVIDEVLAQIDREMSGYRDDSTLSRFNASRSTDWFEVSSDLAKVVSAALHVSELSHGAMDITVAPLVNLWGMGPAGERADLPSDAEIASVREHIGHDKLQVRESPAALRKQSPGLTIDLNAIAPGYAVDLLAARLASLGLANFMIDIGGEVLARGKNAAGEAWRIAVERPVDTDPSPYAIVELQNSSVTTSGEYRHYIERDGHRYSHTIDPRTARPVEHKLVSVVVVGDTSMAVDAWATALNVLGEEAGYELAVQRGMPVMFIVAAGEGRFENKMTPQFKAYLVSGPAS